VVWVALSLICLLIVSNLSGPFEELSDLKYTEWCGHSSTRHKSRLSSIDRHMRREIGRLLLKVALIFPDKAARIDLNARRWDALR
jgi:hypothetical protein